MDKADIAVSISHEPDDPGRQYIYDQISLWNAAQIKQCDYRGQVGYVTATLKDYQANIIAGTCGQASIGCLLIEIVWVAEQARGNGYGRKLLEIIEDQARQLGCRVMELYTFGFQAPDFYPRMGFESIGSYEFYAGGPSKYFFKKSIE